MCGHNGKYRCDCSGFVSYTWKLTSSGGGPTTRALPSYCSHLSSWDELQPGDAILNPGDHVLMFVKWSGKGHNNFVQAACHSPSEGCSHGPGTISYYKSNGFYPCRPHADIVCDSSSSSSSSSLRGKQAKDAKEEEDTFIQQLLSNIFSFVSNDDDDVDVVDGALKLEKMK